MSLFRLDDHGLYCAAGGFHVDPWLPVARAVITHAHGDHARAGSEAYVCAAAGAELLRVRVGGSARIHGIPYGEPVRLGDVTVSLHPAGHILGSAQVRIDDGRGVWVVSGDYKRAADPTCAPFEVVPCSTFVTEATFGLPIYRWPDADEVLRDIAAWWQENRAARRASLLCCYALGKAQRVLAGLARHADEPVWLHGALSALTDTYREMGVPMCPTRVLPDTSRPADVRGGLVLAPPSVVATPWMRRVGDCAVGLASGWMRVRSQRRRRGVERGFVLSDHADWPALVETIAATGARRVLVTHGYVGPLVRWLCERGYAAAPLTTGCETGAARDGCDP